MEEFINRDSKAIERFALQYGCDEEQAVYITDKAFRNLFQEVDNDSLIILFKQATRLLNQIELNEVHNKNFAFEEDIVLHTEILKMEHQQRVTFILSTFQAFNSNQIAKITEMTTSEVEVEIQTAKKYLMQAVEEFSEERFEKRLQFLEKSYSRLPLSFKPNQVQELEHTESQLEESTQPKVSRRGMMLAALLGVLLISLLTTTFFMGDDWALSSDERYVEKLKKNFEKEKNKKMETLGVAEDVFNKIPFIEEENVRFKKMIQEFEKRIAKDQKLNREYGEVTFNLITDSMKLPSELADELFKTPLNDDVDNSMTFIKNYFAKMAVVSNVLFEEMIPEIESFGDLTGFPDSIDFDGELFLSKEKEFNESTQRVMSGLRSQDLPVIPIYFDLGLTVDPARTLHFEQIRKSLHELAGGYITLQEKEPFVVDDKLVYSLDEIIGFIKDMENTMNVDTTANPEYSFSIEGTIAFLLEMIINGKTIEPFRDTDWKINEVHRLAWKRLASFDEESGLSVLMTRIVDEMEASEWEQSELHTALTKEHYRTHEAYSMAARGYLDDFQLEYGDPIYNMYEERVVNPNTMFDETKALYEAFSYDYNESFLVNVHPLLMFSLFYYANEVEDPMMMWLLADEGLRGDTSEEYLSAWEKEKFFLFEAETVSFDPVSITENEDKPRVPIEIRMNEGASHFAWMTYGQDEIWRIEKIPVN